MKRNQNPHDRAPSFSYHYRSCVPFSSPLLQDPLVSSRAFLLVAIVLTDFSTQPLCKFYHESIQSVRESLVLAD